jgi:NAD(P)-dependent dehydrogenase (short-subunit alcohol dehydrogenase family)
MDLSQFSLEGKTALITGGSRGIGEATALAFAKAGADVAITARKQEDLDEVAKKIQAEGRKALAVSAHVGRMDQIQKLVETVMEKFGKIDILVNNAGTSFNAPAIDISEKAWDSVLNLNLKGLFFLSQAVAQKMKDLGGCNIINISSVAGLKVQDFTPHYSISKAAVIMVTKVFAKEWAAYNIRANCIAPGPIQTKLYDAIFEPLPEDQREKAKGMAAQHVPLKRAGLPREIADAILFLASDASSYVTGQTFAVDGGMTC